MNQSYLLLVPVFLPILAGAVLCLMPEIRQRKWLLLYTGIALCMTGIFAVYILCSKEMAVTPFYLTKNLPVLFRTDSVAKLFAGLVTVVWILAGFFSFDYMKHETKEKRYFGFYLITFGVLLGLDFSGNLITMYLFYEFMTLASLPLVLHTGTKEAIMAGLKYAFYSFFGAYMALAGVYFIFKMGNTIEFTPGGVFSSEVLSQNQPLLLIVVLLMIIGFGVKAGMFPLHAWLPTAHPVAPAPASAALSGIIVKSGVLALIRVVYYLVGADFLRGTWVQSLWMGLTLFTVFMGSMLAFREPVLKKRLAYSTVSQISYILFGMSLLHPTALNGSLFHAAAHAFIKAALFLCAGAIICQTGCTRVEQLRGIGRRMPITMWCYTIVSLGLIGIPPTSGFISKWYLAVGALETGIPVFSILGPVVLLVSALLTAGYLLPLSLRGFFPGEGYVSQWDTAVHGEKHIRREASLWMLLPLLCLAALTVCLGLFPNPLLEFFSGITGAVL